MRRRVFGGIYVVRAMKAGAAEYWAAATLWQNAVAEVAIQLGPDWDIRLTDRRLADQRLSVLHMLPNTVRKL
jgi:hypothetical protein